MTVDETLKEALAQHLAGRLPEAEALYRQILAVDSRNFDSLHMLGVIAHQVGRNDIAIDLIGQALAINPDNPLAHCNLGTAYRALGRIDDALASTRRAQAINPDLAMVNNNVGLLLNERGRFAEAEMVLARAVAAQPDYPEAQSNLGMALYGLGRLDEAIARYERALAINPDLAEAYCNLGLARHALGRYEEALTCFSRAVELKPDFAPTHCNLGATWAELRHWDRAEASYRRAIELDPNAALAYNNLGAALQQLGRVAEAVACCKRAIELDPKLGLAHDNLGLSLAALGEFTAARQHYEQAIALGGLVELTVWSNLILTVDHDPAADEAEIQQVRKSWAATLPPRAGHRVFPNRRDPDRKLRIGYVSGDFWGHSASAAFEPVLRCHNRANFDLYLYSNRTAEDDNTARYRAYATVFRPVRPLSDDALEALIREDAIDILVDLSGHSAGNRLRVFARKPAPIQVTAWGYITGTGLPEIDYLFGDPVAVPENVRGHFAERIYDLPCILPFQLPRLDLVPNRLPALERGFVTFGCINRLMKIWPALPVFGRLLAEAPTARLIVKARGLEEGGTRDRVGNLLIAAGARPDQIELRGPSSSHEHLAALHDIDIALDTFPQTGGVTTLESLWLGVPVVTKTGAGISSRVAASLLTALGLTDLIATDEAAYVEIAQRLAADLPALAAFRNSLRERLQNSVICDAPVYTAAVERAYRAMWSTWLRTGKEPGLSVRIA